MTTTAERAQAHSDTPNAYPAGVAPTAFQSAAMALRAAYRAHLCAHGHASGCTLPRRAPQSGICGRIGHRLHTPTNRR